MKNNIEKLNNKESVQVLEKRTILGKEFTIYGTFEEPLFLAKEIAEFIDYAFKDSRQIHRDVSKMLSTIDEDEKMKRTINLGGEEYSHGGIRENTECYFLTEDGLYEVLMQSRKENAKIFKKEVKGILKTIRKTGSYSLPKPMSAMELLELQYKALQETRTEMKQMVEEVKEEIVEFKEGMPLFNVDTDRIKLARNKVAVRLLGGEHSNAYKDRSLRGKVYADMQKELCRQFGVTTYKAIKHSECDEAIAVVHQYKLPKALKTEIENTNKQLRL